MWELQLPAPTYHMAVTEQLGPHFWEQLSPEQQAALDRVREGLCKLAAREQEHNKLLPQSQPIPGNESTD